MDRKEPIYKPQEIFRTDMKLTPEQIEAVKRVLMDITDAPLHIRISSEEKLMEVLQSGHPLNRLILDSKGEIVGFIACRGSRGIKTGIRTLFIEGMGTTKETGCNLLEEIPAFLKSVEGMGYNRIQFAGWNERLNRIMERYGFKKVDIQNVEGSEVGTYEKVITKQSP
jgi:hypothetical protein